MPYELIMKTEQMWQSKLELNENESISLQPVSPQVWNPKESENWNFGS